MDLQDNKFKNKDFDDSLWRYWEPSEIDYEYPIYPGLFESVFNMNNKLLHDGVIWFRVNFDLNEIDNDYTLMFEKGIDDADQTYINGNLIGNTFNSALAREYKISKEILNKGLNSLAIRITDYRLAGGFKGPIKLIGGNKIIEIPFSSLKYKHQAFIYDLKYFMIHSYSSEEIFEKTR